jgi:hypothetical protein
MNMGRTPMASTATSRGINERKNGFIGFFHVYSEIISLSFMLPKLYFDKPQNIEQGILNFEVISLLLRFEISCSIFEILNIFHGIFLPPVAPISGSAFGPGEYNGPGIAHIPAGCAFHAGA